MSASKQASKRLGKEYQAMQKSPPPFVWARPNEANVLEWHYILRGPPDSPYSGGEYWGTLLFPPDYPFAPPTIKMNTPSGRFAPSQAICTSMSSFHPSTWNPAWSVNTILVGLLSFMLGDEITTGSVRATDNEKIALAKSSHSWNVQQPKFKLHFPDYSSAQMKDLPIMGGSPSTTTNDPSAPTTTTTTTTNVSISSSTTMNALGKKVDPSNSNDQAGGDVIRGKSEERNEAEKREGDQSGRRKWFVWAFVVLLISWGGMKLLE